MARLTRPQRLEAEAALAAQFAGLKEIDTLTLAGAIAFITLAHEGAIRLGLFETAQHSLEHIVRISQEELERLR